MKVLKHSKRPLVNVGNSRTTKYRKKIQAIENQKKNGQTLYQLLNNKNNTGGGSSDNNFDSGSSGDGFSGGFSSGGSSGGSFSSDSSSGSDGDSKSNNANKNALINRIKNKLKLESEHLTLGYKLRLIAVQHYLQLLNKRHVKLEASQIVADLLNQGIWFARCVRSWTKSFIEYGDVSNSNREKYLRKSIIDNEDVQLKVTSYLQQHKFDITIHSFCDYIANEILPSI
ncbi:13119_t:CDS:1, partial [Funneliformis caledonium]